MGGSLLRILKKMATPYAVDDKHGAITETSSPPRDTAAVGYCSHHTIENSRYFIRDTRELQSKSDHPNEDKHFLVKEYITPRYSVMAVFDGHDGSKASSLADQFLYSKLINPNVVDELSLRKEPKTKLIEVIEETETKFFEKINKYVQEKDEILSTLPKVIMPWGGYQSLYYP